MISPGRASLILSATLLPVALGLLLSPVARGYLLPPGEISSISPDTSVTDGLGNPGEDEGSPQQAAVAPSVPPEALATPRPGEVTTVPILMYHYIRELPANTPDKLGFGLSISPRLFEQQLSYLSNAGYHSVTMDQVVERIVHGTPLPGKPIVLTFDDGYADFYTAAYPLLQRHQLGATIYLVTDFLNRPGYMTWPQVVELSRNGTEIGAHTLDHVDLAIQQLPIARRQIDDSRIILQQRLDKPVNTFAYPSGRFTPATVKLVGDSGFTSAVTTNFGSQQAAKNLLTMPRVRVPGGISMQDFIRNLPA